MTTLSSLVVRLSTDSAQFDRGFASATRTVGNFGRSATEMDRGLRVAERGFQNLAFRAVGIEGPIGKVAEGLLMFGGGSTLVVGVAAGLGAIGLAMQMMGKDAEEAQKRTADLMKMAQGGGFAAMVAKAPLQDQLQGSVALLNARKSGAFGLGSTQLVTGDARTALMDNVRGMQGSLNAVTLETKKAADETAESIRQWRQTYAMALATIGTHDIPATWDASQRRYVIPMAASATGAQPGGLLAGRGAGVGDYSWTRHPSTAGLQVQAAMLGTPGGGAGLEKTIGNLNMLSNAILLLGSAAGSSGNRFGQFLMGAGGLVGGISKFGPTGELVGAGLSLFGAIANLFGGGGSSKPLPVRDDSVLDALKKQRTSPDHISINILGSRENAKDAEVIIRRQRVLGGRESSVVYGVAA